MGRVGRHGTDDLEGSDVGIDHQRARCSRLVSKHAVAGIVAIVVGVAVVLLGLVKAAIRMAMLFVGLIVVVVGILLATRVILDAGRYQPTARSSARVTRLISKPVSARAAVRPKRAVSETTVQSSRPARIPALGVAGDDEDRGLAVRTLHDLTDDLALEGRRVEPPLAGDHDRRTRERFGEADDAGEEIEPGDEAAPEHGDPAAEAASGTRAREGADVDAVLGAVAVGDLGKVLGEDSPRSPVRRPFVARISGRRRRRASRRRTRRGARPLRDPPARGPRASRCRRRLSPTRRAR